jgi:hypothetical protein
MIATNTTLSREGLRSSARGELGGLSGQPLTRRAQEVAELIRRELPEVFLIGVLFNFYGRCMYRDVYWTSVAVMAAF